MLASRERPRGRIGRRWLDFPSVDNQGSVDIDANAVVRAGRERERAGGELEPAGPAHREVVRPDTATGAAGAPIIVDARLAADKGRRPAERRVREVLRVVFLRRTRRSPGGPKTRRG